MHKMAPWIEEKYSELEGGNKEKDSILLWWDKYKNSDSPWLLCGWKQNNISN